MDLVRAWESPRAGVCLPVCGIDVGSNGTSLCGHSRRLPDHSWDDRIVDSTQHEYIYR